MPDLTDPVVAAGAMAGQAQPFLTVDELTLRPWTARDAPVLVAAYRDPGIQAWHVRSLTTGEADDFVSVAGRGWQQETFADWAVTTGGDVVGRMSLRTVDLELGLGTILYWVVPAARGRAVAGRSLSALTRWSFDELGLHRLELEHSTRNTPSCRVAEKAGYRLEGTKRSAELHADGWHDLHLHARVSGDADPGEPSA